MSIMPVVSFWFVILAALIAIVGLLILGLVAFLVIRYRRREKV